MYFMIKNDNNKTMCEVGIYTDRDTYLDDFWNINLYVTFNIEAYSNYLIKNMDRAEMIKNLFISIQKYVLDYNENVSGDYPEKKRYELDDPEFKEDKAQIIKVTRDRLYKIVNLLGDTGIYVDED